MTITASDGYQTPTYIQYEGTIANALRYRQIYVYDDLTPVPDQVDKVYIKDIETWLAQGEAQAMKNLQNFVVVPLTWNTGVEFNGDISANPEYKPTYTRILNYFINYGLLIVTNNYYAGISDKATGASIYQYYEKLTNKFNADAFKLDQATNTLYRNYFYGLKPVANASDRTPKGCATPAMQSPNGCNAEFMAQNSIPNFRYGVRR